MNYIGSKLSLIDFLDESIQQVVEKYANIDDIKVFADGFAGTGVVGAHFRKKGFTIISNDIQYYSYIRNKHLLTNCSKNINLHKIEKYIKRIGAAKVEEGFITENYSILGTKDAEFQRMYFTDENALIIDTFRIKIEDYYINNEINDQEYYFLISSLLESADKVANTASVYGAFLKNYKKSSLKKFQFKLLNIVDGCNTKNKVYNKKIEEWIKNVKGDILYLDPPYNHRQYGTNYHMLETIAKYDNPVIKGKTGLREYSDVKSDWCSKIKVNSVFEELIRNSKFKFIFLSYNNEGLMSLESVRSIMEKYGRYELKTKEYKRFKADKTENRNHKATSTYEYLHCLIKE